MNIDSQIQALEKEAEQIIGDDSESFLVEVKIKQGNNVKVFIDADKGMSIEKLTQFNRTLYKRIEENGFFPNNDFSLEVSSPGLDEPLKLRRQYVKNIGRFVEVLLNDGVMRDGKLVSAGENDIVVEEEKGLKKKKEIVSHHIAYEDIKTIKIQIKF